MLDWLTGLVTKRHGSLISKFYFRYVRNPYFRACRKLEPAIWDARGVEHLSKELVYSKITDAILKGTPFSALRIGGNERLGLIVLHGGYIPDMRLEQIYSVAGLFPKNKALLLKFMKQFQESLKSADLLGLWYGKNEYAQYVQAGMSASVCNFYDFSGHYGAFASGRDPGWFSALKGKKVMVISSFASLIFERANKITWDQIWAGRIPWFEPDEIIPADFPYGFDADAEAMYGDSLSLLDSFKSRFLEDLRRADVVLAGCGAYAIPLLAWVKQEGKVGIHLAGQIQLLFGIRGHRWDVNPAFSDRLYNDYWIHPPEKYVPKSAKKVENSCYW